MACKSEVSDEIRILLKGSRKRHKACVSGNTEDPQKSGHFIAETICRYFESTIHKAVDPDRHGTAEPSSSQKQRGTITPHSKSEKRR